MPLPDAIFESKFEKDLCDFASQAFDFDELQVEMFSRLLEGLRPLEDKFILIMFGAVHFMADDDYGRQNFATQIHSELQRRASFIESMQRQMRTSFAEKIRSIEEEALRRQQEQKCANS